jgi:hypothetical protein
MTKTLAILVALRVAFAANAQLIPAGELPGGVYWTNWNAGVVGGIPTVSTIFTNFYSTATSAQIQNALNTCPSNQVVYLNSGVYTMSSTLEYGPWQGGNNGVVLRGAGMAKTTLNCSGDGIYLYSSGIFGGDPPTANYVMNWTAGLTQGATNISVDTLTNRESNNQLLQVGDLIGLTQGNDSNVVNPIGNETTQPALINLWGQLCNEQQVVVVKAISGTNLTIWPGVYMTNFQASLHPQIWWNASTPASMFGIEDLTFNMANAGTENYGVFLDGGYNCWLKSVEVTNTGYAAGRIVNSSHCRVSSSNFSCSILLTPGQFSNMADESATPPTKVPAPTPRPKPFTPTAKEIAFVPTDVFTKLTSNVLFDGNVHPVRKQAVEAALAILTKDLQDKGADALRAVISTSGTDTGHRIEITVTSQKYPTE